jgi:hypothetical protein
MRIFPGIILYDNLLELNERKLSLQFFFSFIKTPTACSLILNLIVSHFGCCGIISMKVRKCFINFKEGKKDFVSNKGFRLGEVLRQLKKIHLDHPLPYHLDNQ